MRRQVLGTFYDDISYRYSLTGVLLTYRNLVRGYVKYRQKLKNPINRCTGQPLKPTTIKAYVSELRGYKELIRNYQEEIKALLEHEKGPGSIQG